MKQIFFLLTTCLLLISNAHGELSAQKAAFNAQDEYDAQHYANAARKYEQILQDGFYAPEIFFNLGNAYFKAGDLPRALLNYRRAWYFMPGDADLTANINLAAKTAGINMPAEGVPERIAFVLPQERWVNCAQIGYLLTVILIVAAISIPRLRNPILKCSALPLALALFSCFGIWKWHTLYRSNEQVVIQTLSAKYGPTETSTDHFKIPAGSIVSADTKTGSRWQEIELNENRGWIKKESSSPVVIWKF